MITETLLFVIAANAVLVLVLAIDLVINPIKAKIPRFPESPCKDWQADKMFSERADRFLGAELS